MINRPLVPAQTEHVHSLPPRSRPGPADGSGARAERACAPRALLRPSACGTRVRSAGRPTREPQLPTAARARHIRRLARLQAACASPLAKHLHRRRDLSQARDRDRLQIRDTALPPLIHPLRLKPTNTHQHVDRGHKLTLRERRLSRPYHAPLKLPPVALGYDPADATHSAGTKQPDAAAPPGPIRALSLNHYRFPAEQERDQPQSRLPPLLKCDTARDCCRIPERKEQCGEIADWKADPRPD